MKPIIVFAGLLWSVWFVVNRLNPARSAALRPDDLPKDLRTSGALACQNDHSVSEKFSSVDDLRDHAYATTLPPFFYPGCNDSRRCNRRRARPGAVNLPRCPASATQPDVGLQAGLIFPSTLDACRRPDPVTLTAPSLRGLMVQPGMAACAAVSVVTAIDVASWGIYCVALDSATATNMLPGYWRGHSHHLGLAVAASWLSLLFGRFWRAERGWIDRLGRLLGLLWLLTLMCDWRFGRWTFNAISLIRRGMR